MKSLDILQNIGLSDIEAKTYILLLENGASSAPSLASLLNIKRTTIYPILDRLSEKGVIHWFEQSNRKVYSAVQPNKLADNFSEKLRSLFDIVPYLEKIQNRNQNDFFGVRFIQSKDELKKIYNEVLSDYKNKEYCVIGSPTTWLDTDREFFLNFRKRRAKNKTKVKLLLPSDSKNEVGQDDETLLREYKYLPESYNFKSTIDIYRDKIVIVGPEIKALCVIIAIPPMVDVFQAMFDLLWEKLE